MFEGWARRPETLAVLAVLAVLAEICTERPRLNAEQLKQLDAAFISAAACATAGNGNSPPSTCSPDREAFFEKTTGPH